MHNIGKFRCRCLVNKFVSLAEMEEVRVLFTFTMHLFTITKYFEMKAYCQSSMAAVEASLPKCLTHSNTIFFRNLWISDSVFLHFVTAVLEFLGITFSAKTKGFVKKEQNISLKPL